MLNRIINKIKRTIKPILTFNKKDKFNELMKIININNYSKVIVFENNFGWNGIMRQRPQQIALNMPDDVLFIYHSNKDNYDNDLNYKKVKDNLYLINLDLYRNYFQKTLSNAYLMLYSTNYFKINNIKKYLKSNFKLVFEYVDDIDKSLCGKLYKKLKKQFDFILQNNPYVITTATKLFNNVIKIDKSIKVKLITNGCDYNHFHNNINDIPCDLVMDKPIIGYYGAIASWFDYDLIKDISKTNKYNIVLIGQIYDETYKLNNMNELSNVYYLGKKDYDELPKYLSHFDVCIIPFKINEITLSTSPVKLFEYMAGGKPIVTTDLPECRKYKSILIGKNNIEFIEKLDDALKLKENTEYLKLLDKEALENDWKEKVEEIIDFIKE